MALVRVALALGRCDALAMRARAFSADWCGLQGGSEGKDFLLFALKAEAARAD